MRLTLIVGTEIKCSFAYAMKKFKKTLRIPVGSLKGMFRKSIEYGRLIVESLTVVILKCVRRKI